LPRRRGRLEAASDFFCFGKQIIAEVELEGDIDQVEHYRERQVIDPVRVVPGGFGDERDCEIFGAGNHFAQLRDIDLQFPVSGHKSCHVTAELF